ncbi:PREDICTED: TPRXL [Prunus dulcis]|nr:PREDICTED: TPRXL [Prunus dulcis]
MNVILRSSVDIDTPNPSITEIRQNTRQQLITNIVDSTKLMFVSSSGQELDDYLSLSSNLNKEIKILLEPSAMGMASLTTTTGAVIATSAPMPPSTSAPPQTSASAAGGESRRVNPSMRHTVGSKSAAPDPASRSAPDDEHIESDASASLPSTSSSSEYVLSPSASSSSSEYGLSSPSIEGSAPGTRYSLRPRR